MKEIKNQILRIDPKIGRNDKGILIAYQGGGYDGCIWEWNFCYVNTKWEFEDIAHTGAMGLGDERAFLRYLDRVDCVCYGREDYGDDVYFFNLNRKKDKKEFGNTVALGMVTTVARWLYFKKEIDGIGTNCRDCGEFIDLSWPSDCYNFVDARSMGGIVHAYTNVLCDECYMVLTCRDCGEFIDDVTELDKYHGYCENCIGEQEHVFTLEVLYTYKSDQLPLAPDLMPTYTTFYLPAPVLKEMIDDEGETELLDEWVLAEGFDSFEVEKEALIINGIPYEVAYGIGMENVRYLQRKEVIA